MRQIIYPEMSENPLLLLAFRVMYYMKKSTGLFRKRTRRYAQ